MKAFPGLSFAAILLVGFSAAAQTQAPGLWEQTVVFKARSSEAGKAMAATPDDRKAPEPINPSSRLGMDPTGSTFNVCVSKEDAARAVGPRMAHSDCAQEATQHSANSLKVKWKCIGSDPSTGEGEITFAGDKAYSANAVVTTIVQGKPERIRFVQSGHWLSANCGPIRPGARGKPWRRDQAGVVG